MFVRPLVNHLLIDAFLILFPILLISFLLLISYITTFKSNILSFISKCCFNHNPYNKVIRSVCVCGPKDIANRWIDLVLLYRVALYLIVPRKNLPSHRKMKNNFLTKIKKIGLSNQTPPTSSAPKGLWWRTR